MILPASILTNIKAIAIYGVIIGAGFLYMYIQNIQKDLEIKETEIQKYEIAVQEQSKLIAQRASEIQEIKDANLSLMEVVSTHEKTIRSLQEKFNVQANGQSRDLGSITRVKPKLIENIVNKATSNVNRCFEVATGSEPKENETNIECKELF